MKAIHADPREIRRIFQESYIIPDFQRSYSWQIEQCDKLWEDFIFFHENKSSNDDKYFLGNIVIHPYGNKFAVIDGQQRLTTLILLIKAFHLRAGTVKALEECLKIKDPLTSVLTDEIRLDSRVLENDKTALIQIVNGNVNNISESKLKDNFLFLGEKIDDWRITHNSATELNELILTLLDNLVLLPIHCGSEDDALTIFETINNRGMSLTDSDIFKAKLYSYAGDEKSVVIDLWRNLNDHDWYFRILMHIIRASENDISKEKALRAYFTANESSRLSKWKTIVSSLEKIQTISTFGENDSDIYILKSILSTYPNYYWNFPLFVFLFNNGDFNEDKTEVSLSEENNKKFISLIHSTLKYFFIKGVVYNSVNAIRDTVFKVCAAISHGKDFIKEYKDNITENDYAELGRKLQNKQYGRYLRGLVLISAYLNDMQDKNKFSVFLYGKYDIEHILPKKWNNYDGGWSESIWKEELNSLGNMMPLEHKLNISAQNDFFKRKQEIYKSSKVQDAIDLSADSQLNWTPDSCKSRNDFKTDKILSYLTL